MKHPFVLGVMYWPNPSATAQTLLADMKRIRENSFTVIRSFISWEHLEETQGTFDFSLYDNLYAAAKEAGIGIAQTLGIYPPFWMRAELSQKGLLVNDRYQCLDIPDFSEPCSRFVRAVVDRYKDHPAQFMWFVWNEPEKAACACPYTEKKFGHWLYEKYGTIENLRAEWGKEHHIFNSTLAPASFEDINLPLLASTLFPEKRNYAWVLDWLAFSQDNLAENIRWLSDEVHSIDNIHPTHANPSLLLWNGTFRGQNPWKAASVIDSVGVSIHPCHHFERALDTNDPQIFDRNIAYAYVNDLVRSAASGKDWWVSELQAGANINSGNKPFNVSAADIRQWILQAVAKGASGLLFWLWQAWRSSWECGEFSLVNGVDGTDTERSRAAAEVGLFLKKHEKLFSHAHPVPAKVAILYSPESQALAYRENKSEWSTRAMFGCYSALWRNNIKADFITPDDIAAGILDPVRYKVLYAPYAKVITAETGASIAHYVHGGGALWADGHFAFRGAHSHLHDTNPGAGLSEVFGCKEEDIMVEDGYFQFSTIGSSDTDECNKVQGWLFRQRLTALSPNAHICARYADGSAAAISNDGFGNGRSLMVGTYLCIGYQRRADGGAESLIVDFAKECGVEPCLNISGDFLEVNVLQAPLYDIIVATNHTAETASASITVSPLAGCTCALDLKSGKDVPFRGPKANVIALQLDACDTSVFLVKKAEYMD